VTATAELIGTGWRFRRMSGRCSVAGHLKKSPMRKKTLALPVCESRIASRLASGPTSAGNWWRSLESMSAAYVWIARTSIPSWTAVRSPSFLKGRAKSKRTDLRVVGLARLVSTDFNTCALALTKAGLLHREARRAKSGAEFRGFCSCPEPRLDNPETWARVAKGAFFSAAAGEWG
jgi:hypothetical protein